MASDENNPSNKPPSPPGENDETDAGEVSSEEAAEDRIDLIWGRHLKLKEVIDKLRELLMNGDVNAWMIGHYVNAMDDYQLGPQEGYLNTIDCLEKVFDQPTANTFCRYATVSRYYGKLDVYNFRMDNLYRLVSYQRRVEGRVLRCPPGDYVIHIPQADGSVLAKKFRDCKRDEIPQNPKKIGKQAKKAAGKAPKKVEVPKAKARPVSLYRALIIVAVGTTAVRVADLVPWKVVAGCVWWFGGVLVTIGGFMVLVYLNAIRERWLTTVKDGSVLPLLSQRLATLIALPKAVAQAAGALKAGTEAAVGDGSKPEPTQPGEKQP